MLHTFIRTLLLLASLPLWFATCVTAGDEILFLQPDGATLLTPVPGKPGRFRIQVQRNTEVGTHLNSSLRGYQRLNHPHNYDLEGDYEILMAPTNSENAGLAKRLGPNVREINTSDTAESLPFVVRDAQGRERLIVSLVNREAPLAGPGTAAYNAFYNSPDNPAVVTFHSWEQARSKVENRVWQDRTVMEIPSVARIVDATSEETLAQWSKLGFLPQRDFAAEEAFWKAAIREAKVGIQDHRVDALLERMKQFPLVPPITRAEDLNTYLDERNPFELEFWKALSTRDFVKLAEKSPERVRQLFLFYLWDKEAFQALGSEKVLAVLMATGHENLRETAAETYLRARRLKIVSETDFRKHADLFGKTSAHLCNAKLRQLLELSAPASGTPLAPE